jgi:hypothetical protein
MKNIHNTILTLIIIIIPYNITLGGSVLSSRGVGTPILSANSRALGMGGLSIALADSISISRTNPAGLFNINTTRLAIQYFYEINSYKDPEGSATSQYSNFEGFSFVLPFGSRFGMALDLAPITRLDYHFSFQNNLANEPYNKSVEGSGGLNHISFSLFWGLNSRVALGVSGHYVFGELKELWRVEYDRADFRPSMDELSTKNSGLGFTAGIIVRPFSHLQLGAVYSPEVMLNNQTDTKSIFEIKETTIHEGSLSFPGSWGIGASLQLGRSITIGSELFQRNWTKLAINEELLQKTRKTTRISFGCEIIPKKSISESYWKRIAYRFGFNFQPFFIQDPEGQTINEMWGSLGFGFPLLYNYAQIDVALCFGKRGSMNKNGLSENLFRLNLSITGGEKWFIRRY